MPREPGSYDESSQARQGEMIMVIRLRDELLGRHCHTRVFIGKDWDHLQLSGTLVMEIGEWQLFGAALISGARQTKTELQLPDSDAMDIAINNYTLPKEK